MFKFFNHHLSRRLTILSLVEVVTLFYAGVLPYQWRLALPSGDGQYLGAAVFSVSMVLAMLIVGLYSVRIVSLHTLIQRLLIAGFIALLAMSLAFYVSHTVYVGRGVVMYSAALGMVGVVVVRTLFFWITGAAMLKRRLLILGSRDEANRIIALNNTDPRFSNILIMGFVEVSAEGCATDGYRQCDPAPLQRLVRDAQIDEIVLAVQQRRGGVLPLRQLLDCKLSGIKIVDLITFYEREVGILPLHNLRSGWLLTSDGFDVGGWRDVLKRMVDVLAALIILSLTFPLLLVAAFAVAIESGFPVFFRQERVGAGGKTFAMLKLRSMRKDAEADGTAQWACVNDPRITRVGRIIRATRIDELPQLLNILKGDMSFVGPRPERPAFVRQLLQEVAYYDLRHSIKPGLTGWAQVRYAYGASVAEAAAKLQYDLYYVKNHSLLLDLLIMVQTLEVIFLRKGAR